MSPLSPKGPIVPHKTLYFAYGSNLHLRQMANRCPSSCYVGRARLRGYRFQINQRGYANVVPAPSLPQSHPPDDSAAAVVVMGLCYLLSSNDEARLDVNEGVAIGAYEKHFLSVELFFPDAALAGRAVSDMVDGEGLGRQESCGGGGEGGREGTDAGSSAHEGSAIDSWLEVMADLELEPHGTAAAAAVPVTDEPASATGQKIVTSTPEMTVKGEMVQALVYMSRQYVAEGSAKEEYVGRMNHGIADAVRLGISEEYVEKYMRKYIPFR